jgi:hypothetical protein
MFIIKDWADNIFDFRGRFERPCFAVAMEFSDFDAAMEFIDVNFDDETREEIFVERQGEA